MKVLQLAGFVTVLLCTTQAATLNKTVRGHGDHHQREQGHSHQGTPHRLISIRSVDVPTNETQITHDNSNLTDDTSPKNEKLVVSAQGLSDKVTITIATVNGSSESSSLTVPPPSTNNATATNLTNPVEEKVSVRSKRSRLYRNITFEPVPQAVKRDDTASRINRREAENQTTTNSKVGQMADASLNDSWPRVAREHDKINETTTKQDTRQIKIESDGNISPINETISQENQAKTRRDEKVPLSNETTPQKDANQTRIKRDDTVALTNETIPQESSNQTETKESDKLSSTNETLPQTRRKRDIIASANKTNPAENSNQAKAKREDKISSTNETIPYKNNNETKIKRDDTTALTNETIPQENSNQNKTKREDKISSNNETIPQKDNSQTRIKRDDSIVSTNKTTPQENSNQTKTKREDKISSTNETIPQKNNNQTRIKRDDVIASTIETITQENSNQTKTKRGDKISSTNETILQKDSNQTRIQKDGIVTLTNETTPKANSSQTRIKRDDNKSTNETAPQGVTHLPSHIQIIPVKKSAEESSNKSRRDIKDHVSNKTRTKRDVKNQANNQTADLSHTKPDLNSNNTSSNLTGLVKTTNISNQTVLDPKSNQTKLTRESNTITNETRTARSTNTSTHHHSHHKRRCNSEESRSKRYIEEVIESPLSKNTQILNNSNIRLTVKDENMQIVLDTQRPANGHEDFKTSSFTEEVSKNKNGNKTKAIIKRGSETTSKIGHCTCGVFMKRQIMSQDSPVFSQDFPIACDIVQAKNEEACQAFCKSHVVDNNYGDVICRNIPTEKTFSLNYFMKSCDRKGPWKYTGFSSPTICCNQRKVIPCVS